MASYFLMIFNLISTAFSRSTNSSSSLDAAEDCRIFGEICRQGASVSVIEQHYNAIRAKSARNRRYRRSMEREMRKFMAEEAVSNAMIHLITRSFRPFPVYTVATSPSQNSSSGGAGHADAGVVPSTPGVVPSTTGARNSRISASSSHVSIRVESDEAVNVELAGGSLSPSPESQGSDDPALPGRPDLESQTYSDYHIEDSSAEYQVTLVHRILFGNEANTGVAVRNVIQLSGASSNGVVPPLVWIGFLASLFAPLVRTKWPGFAKDLSLIGHISTAWWHLVLLSTKYRSEQYAFVNTTLTALFCIVIALSLIRASR